jgi:hypothetical protein
VRLYRRQARRDFLKVTKKRKPSLQLIRWGIRRQLQYLRRNLRHIEALRQKTPLSRLEKKQYRDLLVVSQVFSQQQSMYEKKTHTVADRIVSISQPYVRPIVRGKSRAEVEFGAKISVAQVDGYTFLEKLSWDAYNEGSDLIGHVEKYNERFGYYPESVHVDKIYRTRENRSYCTSHGIRLSGPALGRPPKDPGEYRALMKQAKEDEIARIPIEGKFGNGKRRYGLSLLKTKLRVTSETAIAFTFLVMNMEKILRDLFVRFFVSVSNLKYAVFCQDILDLQCEKGAYFSSVSLFQQARIKK